jgi:putative transposase
MPSKRIKFESGEFFHIYNRGTDKRDIFSDVYDYERFVLSLKEFNNIEPVYSLYLKSMKDAHFRRPTSKALDVGRLKTPLIEIIAYSLLPNHFHLLVKQKEDGGISEFMKRMGGGYTKFYNSKHERSGAWQKWAFERN